MSKKLSSNFTHPFKSCFSLTLVEKLVCKYMKYTNPSLLLQSLHHDAPKFFMLDNFKYTYHSHATGIIKLQPSIA